VDLISWHNLAKLGFTSLLQGPDATAIRLMLYGELMSAAGFQHDHIYLEYVITYDPAIWSLEDLGGDPPDKPGVIKASSTCLKATRSVQV
jgi:hypothetical protein